MSVTIKLTPSEANLFNCEICGNPANKMKLMNSGYCQYTCARCAK